jgi:Protein of unknown function (DUF559)
VSARRPLPHGVFLGSHAVAEGLISRRQLQAGLYRRVLQNVYADPGLPLDHQLSCRGVALLMPPEAALAGRSAAAWFGAAFAAPTDPVVVVVPPDSPWRGPRGVRVHRSSLVLGSVIEVEDGVRATDPVRTAWDVATLERLPDAVAMLDGMQRAGHLGPGTVASLLVGAPGRWRARRAVRALSLVDGRAQSPPESWVRVACHQAGLPPPVPQYVVEVDGVFLGQVDLAWLEAKLIVEYEGAYHFDGLQIVRDDRRYARLVAAGWQVIRVSAADLRDLDSVIARICEVLAASPVA